MAWCFWQETVCAMGTVCTRVQFQNLAKDKASKESVHITRTLFTMLLTMSADSTPADLESSVIVSLHVLCQLFMLQLCWSKITTGRHMWTAMWPTIASCQLGLWNWNSLPIWKETICAFLLANVLVHSNMENTLLCVCQASLSSCCA